MVGGYASFVLNFTGIHSKEIYLMFFGFSDYKIKVQYC